MTKEQAIKMLESKMDGNTDTFYEWAETVRMSIKAQEQQTSDDCVSREQVLYIIKPHIHEIISESGRDLNGHTNAVLRAIIGLIEGMPPVTPTRKSELRWIERFDNEDKWLECPHCHKDSDNAYAYCPNCGAKMVGDENG